VDRRPPAGDGGVTRRAALAAVVLATAVAAAPAQAAKAPKLQSALDGIVAGGAPGAIMVVHSPGRTLRLASGLADRDARVPMRAGMHVRIASVTKSYTAAVVLQLVGERKLRLRDSVQRWLPGLVPNGRNISVRQLLGHTSGLGDFEFDPRVLAPYLGGDLGYRWAPRKLAEIGAEQPVFFPPGKDIAYSNTNYVLLGLIVERVTGHSFGRELRSRLIKPLGLHETTFPTTSALPSAFSHGYRVFDQPPAIDITGLYPYSWAAGAIVSTDADVARFFRALLSGRVIGPRLLEKMQQGRLEHQVDFPGQRYGLGLISFPLGCGKAWGHNGDIPGYVTYAFSTRDGRRQMVLTVNQDALSLPREAAQAMGVALKRGFCGA
jgi:D-alanyl-D-alanine carboxypeptidase